MRNCQLPGPQRKDHSRQSSVTAAPRAGTCLDTIQCNGNADSDGYSTSSRPIRRFCYLSICASGRNWADLRSGRVMFELATVSSLSRQLGFHLALDGPGLEWSTDPSGSGCCAAAFVGGTRWTAVGRNPFPRVLRHSSCCCCCNSKVCSGQRSHLLVETRST